ncbi:KR domain-containing protein, partial [Chitinophaga varians]
CDVGDAASVASLISWVQDNYGELHGIIHAAGVVRDSFIINKTAASASAVLSAKIGGVRHLDEASASCRLDFMILFSSLSGVTGNIGQGDYAAANAYLDDYALYRNELVKAGARSGRTQSIAWPLWASEGMQVDEESARYLEREWGMQPLPASSGLALFDRLLQQGHEQVVVFHGKKGLATMEQQFQTSANTSGKKANTVSLEYIRVLVSEELKLPLLKLDPDAAFEQYGIDSVLIHKLTNRLEVSFGKLPRTLFFEYQTLRELADYFAAHHAAKLSALTGGVNSREELPVAPLATSPSVSRAAGSKDIAIVGLSGRYPGARNIGEFWD